MGQVITVALPVFGIIAAGLLAGRAGFLSADDSAALNRFVFRFAMPAALFGLTAGAAPPGQNDAVIALSYGAAALIVMFSSYFAAQAMFAISKPDAGAQAYVSTLGNAVFLGLPIALSVEGWARPFVSLMLIEGVFVISIGAALMAPRLEGRSFIARLTNYLAGPVKNPLVIAMAGGFLYASLGFEFSGPAQKFFSLLGAAAGPTALFSLGLFLATHPMGALKSASGRIAMIAATKLCLLPALTMSIALSIGIDDPAYRGALALFVFVPSGVSSFIMASHYKVDEGAAAAAISATTFLSIFTISGVLMVFA